MCLWGFTGCYSARFHTLNTDSLAVIWACRLACVLHGFRCLTDISLLTTLQLHVIVLTHKHFECMALHVNCILGCMLFVSRFHVPACTILPSLLHIEKAPAFWVKAGLATALGGNRA